MVHLFGAPKPASAQSDLRLEKLESFAGLHLSDYSTVIADYSGFYAQRATASLPMVAPLGLRADGLIGRFSGGAWVGEIAGQLFLKQPRYRFGVAFNRIQLEGGIRSNLVSLNGVIFEDSLLTVNVNLGHEDKSFGEDVSFAEAFFRLYLSERWLLSPGVSYAHSDLKQTRADVILHAEYQFLVGRALNTAVYVQYGGNLFTRASAGLVFYFDGLSFRERDRRTGTANPRFK